MPLSIDDLIDRLTASKLLSADDARSMLSSLAESQRPTDGESLATLLVQSGKLTAFQANRICEGKAESLLLGNYVLLDRIGRGGMGDVFKAEHRRMKRVVALKVVKPEILDSPTALKRFQREVETVAKLDHPNIVVAHDADEAHGVNFLVMQFVDGRDLSSLVKTNGPLPVAKAVDCILQAARGLAYAHDQGIVHRDIKPGNLLLDKKGAVKILDLGLATLMGREARGNESLTASEMIVGTLDYMAPEQAHNSKLADPKSDIYSLGMTLYFLLTGRPAYETESVIEKLLAHREQPVPSLVGQASRLSKSGQAGSLSHLDAIFQKMVAKQPADRHQSMAEVALALEAFQKTHLANSDSTNPALSDATSAWAREIPLPLGEGGRRPGEGLQIAGTPASALSIESASASSVDQTASLLSPISETTAARRKPSEITASAQNRTGRRFALPITFAAASLIVVSGAIWFSSNRWRRPDKDLAIADNAATARVESPTPAADPNLKSKIQNLKPPPPPAVASFDAAQARAHQESWANHLGVPVEQTNSIGMKLRLIPPGEFLMGSADEQMEEVLDLVKATPKVKLTNISTETPQHRVKITSPMLIGETEVTIEKFRQFVDSMQYLTEAEKSGGGKDSNGVQDPKFRWSNPTPGYGVTERSPTSYVTWNDCARYCNWLSAREHLAHCYEEDSAKGWSIVIGANGYRLPTEAEWEYACRAGTTAHFSFGDDTLQFEQHGWTNPDAKNHARAVGLKLPNAFGLFDIHGNVREWCQDWYLENWYDHSPSDDPIGPPIGMRRVNRGGGWTYPAVRSRSASRHSDPPAYTGYGIGFRVIRTLAVPPTNPKSTAPANFALEFNGKDSYVDLPTLRYDGSHPITLEATIVPYQADLTGTVVTDRVSSEGGLALTFPIGGSASYAKLGVFLFGVSEIGSRNVYTRSQLTIGKNIHVAGVLNGHTALLFVDGKVQGRNDLKGDYQPSPNAFFLGCNVWARTTNAFSGVIDELRISKTARYTADFTPQTRFEPDADTLALYHFDDGTGDILTDSSGNNHHGKIVNAKWVPGLAAGPP